MAKDRFGYGTTPHKVGNVDTTIDKAKAYNEWIGPILREAKDKRGSNASNKITDFETMTDIIRNNRDFLEENDFLDLFNDHYNWQINNQEIQNYLKTKQGR